MNANVGDMEEKKRGIIITMVRKEVVGCVQDVIGKNKYLIQLEYRYNRDIRSRSISYVCSKEDFGKEVDESIYGLPQK